MKDQDTLSLAEAVGRLTQEKEELQSRVSDLNEDLRRSKRKRVYETVLWLVPICLLIGLLVYPLARCIASDRKVDHCYIERSQLYHTGTGTYLTRLSGNVEWGFDADIGDFDTVDQAIEAAQKMGCPLK